jgi:DNA repair protein RadD
MELRWYQAAAVESVWKHLRTKAGNPVVELPTGAGKSLVIAELTRQAVTQWNGRVLILQHVKELIEQNAAELQTLCPTIRVGLYSAGLKRRETDAAVVVAGIQSVYDKADQLGRFDLVLIDEGHLIPDSGDGMYRQLIRAMQKSNEDLVIIGLTATPYRTSDGPICSAEGLLNAICYSVSVRTLIAQGFLSKLIGRRAEHEIDTTGIRVRGGEFIDGEVEERMLAEGVVQQAADEVVHQCRDRKSCLVFCQTVSHAEQVAAHILRAVQVRQLAARGQTQPARDLFDLGDDELTTPILPIIADWLDDNGQPTDHLRRYLDTGRETVAVLTGQTPSDERARLIEDFKAKRLKYLVNVNVLTTGFNAKNVDCVAILRATLSPGLFYQMVGRGFRLHESKENCLVLDFGGNIERHGPVDDIRPRKKAEASGEVTQKMCPECRAVVSPAVRTCPGCNYIWPVEAREPSHNGTADGDPLSKGATDEVKAVTSVEYRVHTKQGASDDSPKTLRVTYKCGLADYVSEWVCIEHPEGGFAHQKAEKWWRKRCLAPMPKTAAEAVVYALHGLLAEPTEINVRTKKGEKFPEIVKQTLGEVPEGPDLCGVCGAEWQFVLTASDSPNTLNMQCGVCSGIRRYTPASIGRRFIFDYDDPKPLLPDEVLSAYDRAESDAPRDSDDTRSRSFDLLTAMEQDNPF